MGRRWRAAIRATELCTAFLDEGAEGLADTMRDDFGMVDCRKNGGDQSEGLGCGQWNAGAKDCVDT